MEGERRLPVRRALLSVYEKQGIVEFARALAAHEIEILASGATAAHLAAHGIRVRTVEEYTGLGETFGGRLKTLTPKIHGGLLLRRKEASDVREAERQGILPIDLLCVNLYPFREAVARHPEDREGCIEMIDVGGPAMIRAAAKNHADVVVVSSPGQYERVVAELTSLGGRMTAKTAADLAMEAFALTSAYDAAVFRYLQGSAHERSERFLDHWATGGKRWMDLRYGENPSQPAACYSTGDSFWSLIRIEQGKQLSYNNLADLWAAWRALCDFPECAAVVVKHRTPSGLALAADPLEAYRQARDADALSAFGGIALVNRPGDLRLAEEMSQTFLEVVGAPGWSREALALLGKKKNLRVIELPSPAAGAEEPALEYYSLGDAALVQGRMGPPAPPERWTRASKAGADEHTLKELFFAWRVVRHVRSNAIAVTRDGRTIGIGCGQTSRIDACEQAFAKANRSGHDADGTVLASDAFFPFPDVVRFAAEAGVRAIVQPGGSRNDAESVAACDEAGLPMYFTGERAFVH